MGLPFSDKISQILSYSSAKAFLVRTGLSPS